MFSNVFSLFLCSCLFHHSFQLTSCLLQIQDSGEEGNLKILGVCGKELPDTVGEVVSLGMDQLDLLSMNREGLLDDVVAKGHLGQSDHEMIELSIL